MKNKKKFIAYGFVFMSLVIILAAGGCHQSQDPDVVEGSIPEFSFYQ